MFQLVHFKHSFYQQLRNRIFCLTFLALLAGWFCLPTWPGSLRIADSRKPRTTYVLAFICTIVVPSVYQLFCSGLLRCSVMYVSALQNTARPLGERFFRFGHVLPTATMLRNGLPVFSAFLFDFATSPLLIPTCSSPKICTQSWHLKTCHSGW